MLKNNQDDVFPLYFGRKKSEIWIRGRKSTYCDTTDIQPTAQRVKLGLNPLPLLLIHQRYKLEVGKLSGWFFPAVFWAKKVRNVNRGDENRHTVM